MPEAKIESQPACKPGSVWPCTRQDVVIIHLGCLLPGTSTQPTRTADLKTGLELPPHHPYSVLLPMGFTLPASLLTQRWALTPPFHPYQNAQNALMAVCFLWHFPLGSRDTLPQPGVTRHRVSMEPGLSSAAPFRDQQQQSPDRLALPI